MPSRSGTTAGRSTEALRGGASTVFDLSTVWTGAPLLGVLGNQFPLDEGLRLPQRPEAAAHALLVAKRARHPDGIDAAEDAPAEADRQGDRPSMRPDLAALPESVAAAPCGGDQARSLGRIARKRVVRVARLREQPEQGRSLIGRRE